jgi:hypothetical protein
MPGRGSAAIAALVLGACAFGLADGSARPGSATASPVFSARGLASCIQYYRPERLVCTRRGNPSTLSMRPRGSVRTGTLELNEPVSRIAFRPLLIGETWSEGRDFRCRHRRTGLTCRNASDHGWWLGRPSGFRIF